MIDPIIIAATKEAVLGELGGSGGGGFTIPHFDLTAMGLPTVVIGGETIAVELDANSAAALRSAMIGGMFSAAFKIDMGGMAVEAHGAFTCLNGESVGMHQGAVILYDGGTAVLFGVYLSGNELAFFTKVIQ